MTKRKWLRAIKSEGGREGQRTRREREKGDRRID